MRTKKATQLALQLTEGLLKTTTDVVLYIFFLTCASAGKSKTSIGAHQSFTDAQTALNEFNYDVIKRALAQLKHKGLVAYKRKNLKETIAVTKEGKQRLEQLLPIYQKQRTWDHRMYLVTYDIAETRRYNREILRQYLRRIGAAMLQESIWITPYNPRETLRSFLEEQGLSDVVIVSDLGKDAIIGEIDLLTLVRQLYHLDKLNERYEQFIETNTGKIKPYHLSVFQYLSILRDDPQLPFPLLPKNWLGDKAYELIMKRNPLLHL